jgi:hypothetical protein
MDVIVQLIIDLISTERIFSAIITSIVAFIGVLIGVLSSSHLQRRNEKVLQRALAASLAAEIDVSIEHLKSEGNLRDTIESAHRRFKDNYTGPFPRYFDSKISANELNKNWFPIFRTSSSKIGLLGVRNAKEVTRFHLLMNSVFSDFIRYSHQDFWGHDHQADSKLRIAENHLNLIDEAIITGEKISKSLQEFSSK